MTSPGGRTVVVTGASGTLGQALAGAFSEGGAIVGLVGRNREPLDALAAELPGKSLVCAGDVRDDEFNHSVARQMVELFGHLDVWICNAGISPVYSGPVEMSAEVWRAVIDTNLTGAFLGARAAAGVMGANGRIIVTGSVLGTRPRRGLSAYSASKAALQGMVQALALDLGDRGITVNLVAPGWFESQLAAAWTRDPVRHAEVRDHTALGRWGKTRDLVAAYLYLASDSSAYVTGTVLTVDGGYQLV